jgi:hypothetical protein
MSEPFPKSKQRTYADVMAEAGDNSAAREPSQPAPEHTANRELLEAFHVRYYVNATVSFPATLEVEAATADDAFEEAKGMPASYWDYDSGSGMVEFDVSPEVESA